VSPTLAIAGRTAGGLTIAAFAILLLMIAWIRAQDAWLLGEDGRRWLYVMVGALGLGLASAPQVYGALATLLLAWLAQSTIGPPIYQAVLKDEGGRMKDEEEVSSVTRDQSSVATSVIYWPERGTWRTAGIIGGVVFVAAATMFLWNPAGFG